MAHKNPSIPLIVLLLGGLISSCAPEVAPLPQEASTADQANFCTTSNQCPIGDVCLDGTCTPYQESECNSDDCVDLIDQCLTSTLGCECHILNAGHTFNIEGSPQLHFWSNETQAVQAQIALIGGDVLSSTGFEITVADSNFFTVSDDTLTAQGTQGHSAIRVNFGALASCTANVVNHGPPPSNGGTQILLYDPASGSPISDATVMVKRASHDERYVRSTGYSSDTDGIVSIPLEERAAIEVSVFHRDYDYLTLMNFSDVASPTMRIPLSPRGNATTVGAVRGNLGFESHLDTLGLNAGSIRLGIVSTSFPLKQLEYFGPGLFLGGSILGENCEANPQGPGCYNLSLPGVLEQHVALWGGLIVSLPTTPLKPHFDVMGTPGRRFVWSLGGTWEAGSAASVFQSISQRPEGNCPTCPTLTDSSIMRSFQHLIGSASMGFQGNVPLHPAPLKDWLHSLTDSADSDPRFIKLDNGRGGPALDLTHPMDLFSELRMPPLPADPLFADQRGLAGFMVVNGVQTLGSGFLPLGFGLGFDCDEDCSIRGARDGIVNAAPVCDDDDRFACEGRTDTETPEGTVGVFHRSPTGNLAHLPRKTFVLALPLDSIGAVDFRVRGAVLDGPLGDTESLEQLSFVEAPGIPPEFDERHYSFKETQNTDVHHVTLNPVQPQSGDSLPRWHIYSPNASVTFTAPVVPPHMVDPLRDLDSIRRTHATVQLEVGVPLSEILSSPTRGIHQLLDAARGFSSISIRPNSP